MLLDPTDIDIFFDDGTIEAIYELRPIRGHFRKNYQAVSIHTNQMESFGPAITFKNSDIEGIKQGASLMIADTEYFVKEIQPDNNGRTKLFLSEDAVQ